MSDVMDDLLSGAAPAFTFTAVGDEITGVVVEMEARQDHVYDAPDPSKALLWWNRPDGPERGDPADRPKMIFIFTLQTAIRDGDEDDGLRTVWARGQMIIAARAAIKAAFAPVKPSDKMVIGSKMKVTLSGRGEKQKGKEPAKLFTVKVQKPQVTATLNGQADAHNEANPPPADTEWGG